MREKETHTNILHGIIPIILTLVISLLGGILSFAHPVAATNHSISVTTSGTVNITAPPGLTGIGNSDINVATTCKAGYNFVLSTSANDNKLYLDGDATNNTENKYLSPSDGATILQNSSNAWGYSLAVYSTEDPTVLVPPTANNIFLPVPTNNSTPATLKDYADTASETTINDEFSVYYGISTATTLENGTYTLVKDESTDTASSLKYTVTANPTCATDLSIAFNKNLNGAGSETDDGTTVSNFPTTADNTINVAEHTITLSDKIPTRTGYTFVEWNTQPDGSGTSYQPAAVINIGTGEGELIDDTTLYAIWNHRLSTTIINGIDLNKAMKALSGMSGHNENTINTTITAIKQSATAPATGTTTAIVSEPTSETDITMWYDNGIIYYYTLADDIYTGTSCYRMFAKFQALAEIDLISQFITTNAITMKQMFDGTTTLATLDLSHFDTSNVTDMEAMFWGDTALTSLNVSNFDTSKVTSMYQMFYSVAATELNLSNFNTENVTTMQQMFYNMTNIKSLDLSSFSTPKLGSMAKMFNRDSNLESITFGKNFDTSKVTSMQSLFDGCSKITTLDLSYFDTGSVTDMSAMFYGMTSLTTIYVSEDFDRTNVTNSNAMFQNDNNLVGELGTRLSTTGNSTNMTYAQIDNSTHNGYFTFKDISIVHNTITINLPAGVNSITFTSSEYGTQTISSNGTVELVQGESYIIIANIDELHDFASWSSSEGGILSDSTINPTTYIVTDDGTLTLSVTDVPSYTVTVSLDAHSSSVSFYNVNTGTQTVTENGGTVSLRRGLTYVIAPSFAEGYQFASWATTVNGTLGSTSSASTTYVVTDTTTLTLTSQEYVAPSLSVSFDENADDVTIANFPTTEDNTLDTENNTLTISDKVPTRSDYTFVSWNTAADGNGETFNPGQTLAIGHDTGEYSGTITLYAIWTQRTTLDITLNYGAESTFDGRFFIDTGVPLFSASNRAMDFDIDFGVGNTSYITGQSDNFNVLVADMDESGSPYPGFVLRYNGANATNYTLAKNNAASGGANMTFDKATSNSFHFERRDGVLYASSNVKELAQVIDFSNAPDFNTNLSFGAAINGSGAGFRYFGGTLTNATLTEKLKVGAINYTLPTPTFGLNIFNGWYSDAEFTNKVGDGGDVVQLSDDTTLYAKWERETSAVQEYHNTGPITFDGTENTFINTKIYPYASENINRNILIEFNVDSFNSTNANQATLMNVTLEKSPYPGVLYRLNKANSSNVQLRAASSSADTAPVINGFTGNVRIVRIGGTWYYSLDGAESISLIEINPETDIFNIPITFGGSMQSNLTPYRFFNGVLSNLNVEYLPDDMTIEEFDHPELVKKDVTVDFTDGHIASITFSSGSYGTVTATPSSPTVSLVDNATYTITASVDLGYQFDGWTTTSGNITDSTANPTTYSTTEADTLAATSQAISTYNTTVRLGDNVTSVSFYNSDYGLQTVTTDGGEVTLYDGIQYMITATTATGHESTEWTTGANGTLGSITANPTTYVISGVNTLSVTAKIQTYTCTKQYRLQNADGTYPANYTVDGTEAINYGDTCSYSKSETNYTTQSDVITMTDDATISLDLTRNTYTLIVNKNDTYISSVTGAGTYRWGEAVNITATVSSNNRFAGWSQTAGATSSFGNASNASTTFTMPVGDATIYADGEAIPSHTITVGLDANVASVTFYNADYGIQTVTSDGGTITLYDGVEYTITATVAEGYNFASWTTTSAGTLGSTTTNPTTYTITGTSTLSVTSTKSFGPDPVSSCNTPVPNYTYMQEINSSNKSAVLASLTEGNAYYLRDNRDEEPYCVSKLADGNLWMLDNLRLGSTSTIELTSDNTHLASGTTYTLPASGTVCFGSPSCTATDGTSGTGYTKAAINTDYKNTTTTNYGSGSGKIGTYYNYCAASAGTICAASGGNNDDATYDICPKGWRMPTGNTSGEYNALYTAYSSNATNFRNALSTPLSGRFVNGSARYQGSYGDFWSSTRYSGNGMYYLLVNSSSVNPTGNYGRYDGYSLRCLLGSSTTPTSQNMVANDTVSSASTNAPATMNNLTNSTSPDTTDSDESIDSTSAEEKAESSNASNSYSDPLGETASSAPSETGPEATTNIALAVGATVTSGLVLYVVAKKLQEDDDS